MEISDQSSSSQSEMMIIKDRRPEGLGDFRVFPDELICVILECLSPRDIARLSCVSSVMYILCNEEPMWMYQWLNDIKGPLEYKGSWKKTALYQQGLSEEFIESCSKPLSFDGFYSLFLYKRLYRCFTTLGAYSIDKGDVERRKNISLEEFQNEYDVQKPVLLTELAETWPARSTWTIDQLLHRYSDTAFKISQRSSQKITMKFKDYVSYMKLQHDEDPLYIFDDKFGEIAPDLLKDYDVPHLFQEDFFDVLDSDQRPPFRWLIIGPERSGASWHVDPALTSAWNTLLCGRKSQNNKWLKGNVENDVYRFNNRWALYPPGRVPLGVTVHENEDDGDINVESPTSLQWWLDIYPLLADQDKPIECTQLPGETIFVPSGWWHCVLNLETTIAVTQNFVNSKNFEFVCLDMAPGHRHKGVCRAGLLAVDEGSLLNGEEGESCDMEQMNYSNVNGKEKRLRISDFEEGSLVPNIKNGTPRGDEILQHKGFTYDISFLSMFLEEERDHYNSIWSPGNCIGERELRQWLHKLWTVKPAMRDLIWKGACLALNVDKWSTRMAEICAFHNLPSPSDDERFPVGTGSNPVYLTGECVIKICVEGGLESSIYGLGTELEFYNLLCKVNSPLKNYIPEVLACGILVNENGSYKTLPWDGKGVPDVITKCNLIIEKSAADGFPFGVWNKKEFECRKAGMPANELVNSEGCSGIWPYIITRRCNGNIFAHVRENLSLDDSLNLASFLGEQLRNLHLLPLPPIHDSTYSNNKRERDFKPPLVNGHPETDKGCGIPEEWKPVIEVLIKRKKDVSNNLTKWGDPIPSRLIEKVEEYLPDDLAGLLSIFEDKNGLNKVPKSPVWIHSDIMDDNIHMVACSSVCSDKNPQNASQIANDLTNGCTGSKEKSGWRPSHILDFSDLSIGDPICDVIPIHLDVFRGDSDLLRRFLESYNLPLLGRTSSHEPVASADKFGRLSYHVMCHCILHEENILGAIFSLWKELKKAESWEEIEEAVWGNLNIYEKSVCAHP